MEPRYVRIRELATTQPRDGKPGRQGLLPVSGATIWRWVALGQFPAPVKLGPQTSAWSLEVIDAWQRQRAPRQHGTINGGAK